MNYGHGVGVVTSRTISLAKPLHITTFTNSISSLKAIQKMDRFLRLLSDSKIYTLNNMHYTSLKILL